MPPVSTLCRLEAGDARPWPKDDAKGLQLGKAGCDAIASTVPNGSMPRREYQFPRYVELASVRLHAIRKQTTMRLAPSAHLPEGKQTERSRQGTSTRPLLDFR